VITEQLNFADCANVKIARGAFLMTLATKLLREYDENAHFGEGQTYCSEHSLPARAPI
jgi:hypothetical protein